MNEEKQQHKFIIKYCEDTKTFMLICEECFRCLELGECKEIPVDCAGRDYEGNNWGGSIRRKVL